MRVIKRIKCTHDILTTSSKIGLLHLLGAMRSSLRWSAAGPTAARRRRRRAVTGAAYYRSRIVLGPALVCRGADTAVPGRDGLWRGRRGVATRRSGRACAARRSRARRRCGFLESARARDTYGRCTGPRRPGRARLCRAVAFVAYPASRAPAILFAHSWRARFADLDNARLYIEIPRPVRPPPPLPDSSCGRFAHRVRYIHCRCRHWENYEKNKNPARRVSNTNRPPPSNSQRQNQFSPDKFECHILLFVRFYVHEMFFFWLA